jgi:hypothetical protein
LFFGDEVKLRNGLLTASDYRGAWRVEENEEIKKERRWEGERMGRREIDGDAEILVGSIRVANFTFWFLLGRLGFSSH